jgi:hypothetical protein
MAPRSVYWKYFTKINKESAKCNICPNSITKTGNYSTSGLKAHVQRVHSEEYKTLVSSEMEKARKTCEASTSEETCLLNSSTGPFAKRPRTTEPVPKVFQPKYGLQDPKQLEWDLLIMSFLAMANLPFNLVENPGFKKLMHHADPRMTVKSPTTFSRSKLPQLYTNVKARVDEKLNHDLPDAEGAGFSTDMWTSKNNESYQGMTIHYINKGWTLVKFLIGCMPFPENHTGDNIAQKMNQIIDKLPLGFQTTTTCVTDQGANVVKGVEKSNIDNHLSCVDHILHLVVQGAVSNVQTMQAAMDKCTELSTFTHRSSISQTRIKTECDYLNLRKEEEKVTYKKIIRPCSTRWNSFHMCMQSVLDMKTPLMSIQKSCPWEKLSKIIPTEDEFDAMQSNVFLLKRIRKVSEVLSADTKPTLHRVVRDIFNLVEFLKENLHLELSSRLLEQLNARLPECGSGRKLAAMAHFLDPYCRGCVLTTMGDKMVEVQDMFVETIPETQELLQDSPVATENNTELDSDDEYDHCSKAFQQWTKIQPQVGQKQRDGQLPVKKEIAQYVEFERPTKDYDILDWWKNHSSTFPILSRFAKQILCIPATSTSSERIFSQSGAIVTHKREKIHCENVEMLVYIKDNIAKVNIKNWDLSGKDQEILTDQN